MNARTALMQHPELVAVIALTLGCSSPQSENSPPEHRAEAISVDTLLESDSLFVARISRAFVTPRGHIIVSDQHHRRIVEFDTAHRPVRTLGRAGDGPGEFRGPAAIALWGRDSLVVTDLTSRQLSVFRLSDGTFLWRAKAPGSVASLAPLGKSLVVAALAPEAMTAVAVISPGQRELSPALPVADSLTRETIGVAAFPRSVVAAKENRLAVALLWSDVVVVYDSLLTEQLSFAAPRRARRPIPPNLSEALRPIINTPGRMTFMPALTALEWLDNGMLVLVHKDWIAPPGGVQDPSRVLTEASLRVYATLVDLEKRTACADISLPSDWAENPLFFSDGGTVVGLGHALGATLRPTLEYRRFDLQTSRCEWETLPISHSHARTMN